MWIELCVVGYIVREHWGTLTIPIIMRDKCKHFPLIVCDVHARGTLTFDLAKIVCNRLYACRRVRASHVIFRDHVSSAADFGISVWNVVHALIR